MPGALAAAHIPTVARGAMASRRNAKAPPPIIATAQAP